MFHNDNPNNTYKVTVKKKHLRKNRTLFLNFIVFVWQLLLPVIDHLKKKSLTNISINGKCLAPCAAKHFTVFFYV